METRKIGSLDVSVVGLGCNNFGGRIDADATKSVIDASLYFGINFFDTADIYGGTKSEEFLGQALGTRRDQVILASKFGAPINDAMPGGAKPEYIQKAVEDSLRRLNTDRIDLYQLHLPDDTTPIADTLGALNELVQAGKVREIGCSNFSAAQLQEAEAAVGSGAARFASVQNDYSLLKRDPEAEVLPECEKLGIAFLPYFPLASGLLTGKYRQGQPLPEGARIKADGNFSSLLSDKNLATVEALIQFAESRGHTILELAFSWLLTRKSVASVIAGATKPEQIAKNAAAADWHLSDDDLKEIDAILA
jgi:aryl-alcohol dehydrogenase-like predicted oxidoreductase